MLDYQNLLPSKWADVAIFGHPMFPSITDAAKLYTSRKRPWLTDRNSNWAKRLFLLGAKPFYGHPIKAVRDKTPSIEVPKPLRRTASTKSSSFRFENAPDLLFSERKERKREDRNNRSPIRAAKNGLLAPANTGTLCGRPLRRTASARTTDSIRSFRLDQRAMPKCTVTTMTGHFLRNNETNASSTDTKEHLQQIAEKENVDMWIQMLQMPETTFKQPESPVGPLLNRNHFHEHFDTDAYLRDFYTRVEDPAMQLVLFHLPNLVPRLGPLDSLLDFGCGPTIHVAVCFRQTASKIFLADYLPQNRAEVGRWLGGRSKFDWGHVLRIIAAREALPLNELNQMERQTRAKIRAILHCDCLRTPAVQAFDPGEMAGHSAGKANKKASATIPLQFGAITTFFTLEYCCLTREEYAAAVQRVCAHLEPGGLLIMGGVLEETWCAFGGRKFHCLYIDRCFMLQCLANARMHLWHDHLGTELFYENDGMFLLVAKKEGNKEHEDVAEAN